MEASVQEGQMLELSGVNLTPHIGQRIEAFCSTNINKELI
jgi:hypothetical protein